MKNLTDQLKAALDRELECNRCGERAEGVWDRMCPRTGYELMCDWQYKRNEAIDQALCEVVAFLERNAPRFYGETEVELEILFERLRAALEGRG